MSRESPIYLYASDEEPTEATFDSRASSVHESPSIHIRATSDDTSDAPHTLPVTRPVTTPAVGESSRRPLMRRTPRMVIRDFPTGPLAPRDKAPTAETETSHEEPPRRMPRPAHLEWMPRLLSEWRALEGIPSTYETGESSRAASSMPLTGEPLEQTVPTLVAVIRTLFKISSNRCKDIRELESDASRLDGDMMSAYERLDFVESHRMADREIAEAARARVEVLEGRMRIAGMMVGACVMLAVLWAVVVTYFPY